MVPAEITVQEAISLIEVRRLAAAVIHQEAEVQALEVILVAREALEEAIPVAREVLVAPLEVQVVLHVRPVEVGETNFNLFCKLSLC